MPGRDVSMTSEDDSPSANPEVREYIRLLASEHAHEHGQAFAWLVEHPAESRPAMVEMARKRTPYPLALAVFHILGRIGDPADVPLLTEILCGRDSALVWDSAQALGFHRSPQAMDALLAALRHEKAEVVEAAAVALGMRGDEAARPSLEGLLEHPQETVRYRTVFALRKLGISPSAAVLQTRLAAESSEEVRTCIREALADGSGG
jgi:hypothetical protein